jgi:hypothetical protein
MSWTIKSARQIVFRANAYVRTWVDVSDIEYHSEVEKIKKMNVTTEEKIAILKEREKDILNNVVMKKWMAVEEYAESSQDTKIDIELGDSEGSIDWAQILGVGAEEEEPVV